MVTPETERNILNYLSYEATSEELDFLSDWILHEENQRLFDDYVQTHYEVITAMNKPDTDKIKNRLLRQIKRDKKRRILLGFMKYAALVLLLMSLGYLYQNWFTTNESTVLVPKEEVVTITLDNGDVQILDSKGNTKVKDSEGRIIGKQDRSKLTYQELPEQNKVIYNTLKVPFGKRFDVILSDGTHVFLNAGTSLRYPVTFIKGTDRTVFLTGEAYFEVTSDKKHPFIVNANGINVKVLGTKFNVSNYPDDTNINTVLVEGSVALHKQIEQDYAKPLLLKPGFKAEWSGEDNDIVVAQVDVNVHTAWLQGKLIFRNASFLKIRQSLERKYNITMRNNNRNLDQQVFDATFDIETIEEVLESFNKSYAIEYEIVDNEVIIK